jgi:hypothetical protein
VCGDTIVNIEKRKNQHTLRQDTTRRQAVARLSLPSGWPTPNNTKTTQKNENKNAEKDREAETQSPWCARQEARRENKLGTRIISKKKEI